jgi:hypothetical protein
MSNLSNKAINDAEHISVVAREGAIRLKSPIRPFRPHTPILKSLAGGRVHEKIHVQATCAKLVHIELHMTRF